MKAVNIRWMLVIVLWGIAMSGVEAATQVGGMTIEQAFPDPRVVHLVEAASSGDANQVKAKIKAGADVNYVGTKGMTPLVWLYFQNRQRGIEFLLDDGADPNYREPVRGVSILSMAAHDNETELLELLLKHKGNPDLVGPDGRSLLQLAVFARNRKSIDLLLQYGANVNLVDSRNETAANTAVGFGQFDVAAQFLERGLVHNLQDLAKDVEISTVPQYSDAQRWKEKVIEMLKARGVKFPAFVRPERDKGQAHNRKQ